MFEEDVCPLCGGDMVEWNDNIFECQDCGFMLDLDMYQEETDTW